MARRILVLGSPPRWRGVRAHSWRAIPDGLNVADYDVVILNFVEFEDEGARTNVDPKRVPSAASFARLLFSSGSTVVAIGSPFVKFGSEQPMPFGSGTRLFELPATWWLPVELPVVEAGGEAIDVLSDSWRFWFRHLDRFDWHFTDAPKLARDRKWESVRAVMPRAEGAVATWSSLASTRYGDPIGVSLTITAFRTTNPERRYGEPEYETHVTPGGVFWLPAANLLEQESALTELLQAVGGIDAEVPAPDWIKRFALPRQADAEEEVITRRNELEQARAALDAAEKNAEQEGAFRRLLYEQGKEVLEPIVRQALGELGAAVTNPAVDGIEDGRLTDPSGRAAMIEVKGRRGQLGLEDVRQLDGWMRTAIADEGWSGKGIVVANLKLEEPADERVDLIAPNALAFAEKVDIAILTTGQVFEAISELQREVFDSDAFWDAVFRAAGLVEGLSGPSGA